MPDLTALLNILLKRNPNVVNNKKNQDMLEVIQKHDNKRGEEIAENLCRTYGVTKEEALAMAKEFFHI